MDESEGVRSTEDQVTKTIETYTAAIPSTAYLGVGRGAMALSLLFQVPGRGKWGNFIAQGAYMANHWPVQQNGKIRRP